MRTYEICRNLLGVPGDAASDGASRRRRPVSRPGITGSDLAGDTRYFQRDYDGNIDDEEECRIEFYTRTHFRVML